MARAPAQVLIRLGTLGLLLGGGAAMLMRWHLGWPGLFSGRSYPAAVTLHGVTMIYLAMAPLLGGLSLARLQIAHRLAWAAVWLTGLAQLSMACALSTPLFAPAVGWTMLAPLSTEAPAGQWALAALTLSVTLATLGSLAVSWLVFSRLAPRHTRLSARGFSELCAAGLNLAFAPVLLAANALLLRDQCFGSHHFAATRGDPMAWQHLFWIFGHPEVYILVLPLWGAVSDIFLAGLPGPLDRGVKGAMLGVSLLAGGVYGHHLVVTPQGPFVLKGFSLVTLAISLPSALLIGRWLVALLRAPPPRSEALGYGLATLYFFAFGGLTGLPLGLPATNRALHGGAFVVGHFHLVMAAAMLFALWALAAERAPIGEMRWHRRLSFLTAHGLFVPMLALGLEGVPRRAASTAGYVDALYAMPLQRAATVSGLLFGALQVAMFLRWLAARPRAPEAPRTGPEATLDLRPLAVSLAIFVGTLGLTLHVAARREGADPRAPERADTATYGARLYALHCAQCHGATGRGDGPSGAGLSPPPRDFSRAQFKYVFSVGRALPSDDDLARTITRGLGGTAMRPWGLSPDEVAAVIAHLKTLSPRWADAAAEDPRQTLAAPTPPDPFGASGRDEALALGARLYHGFAQCIQCHPAYLTREAAAAALALDPRQPALTWRDDAERPRAHLARPYRSVLLAPDFARHRYAHEGDPEGLFRAIAGGIQGTAMPAWQEALSARELWALVHYVSAQRP